MIIRSGFFFLTFDKNRRILKTAPSEPFLANPQSLFSTTLHVFPFKLISSECQYIVHVHASFIEKLKRTLTISHWSIKTFLGVFWKGLIVSSFLLCLNYFWLKLQQTSATLSVFMGDFKYSLKFVPFSCVKLFGQIHMASSHDWHPGIWKTSGQFAQARPWNTIAASASFALIGFSVLLGGYTDIETTSFVGSVEPKKPCCFNHSLSQLL